MPPPFPAHWARCLARPAAGPPGGLHEDAGVQGGLQSGLEDYRAARSERRAVFTIASTCGWFHGAIAPTTPTGSRRTRVLPEAKAGRRSSHSTLRASPA